MLSNTVEDIGTCRSLAQCLGLVLNKDSDPVKDILRRMPNNHDFAFISLELFKQWLVRTKGSLVDFERAQLLLEIFYDRLLQPDLTHQFMELFKVSLSFNALHTERDKNWSKGVLPLRLAKPHPTPPYADMAL